MAIRKPKKVFRELTDAEWQRVETARAQVQGDLPELMEKGRAVFAAHEAARQVIAELKVARDEQGISLSDVMERSGITREAISRLENDITPNPTVRTLVRYAAAIGLDLSISMAAAKSK